MTNIATLEKEQFLLFEEDTVEQEVVHKAKPVIQFKEADPQNIAEMLPELYDHQREDVLKIERRFQVGKGYLITNGTGTGKAQPLYSQIMTPTGIKSMGEIKPGDFVISSEGKPIKVLGVYPQGIKKIYEVKFSDGATVRCCDDHLWETQTLYERRKASANPNWNCAKPKVRSLSDIRNTLEKQHFIPIVDPVKYDSANPIIPPYIMGSILGDGGFTTGTIVFTTNDQESVEKIKSMLPEGLIIRKIKSNKSPQYRIALSDQPERNSNGTFGDHPWIRVLKDFKLYGLKSDEKFVPEEYLKGSIQQRTELLQGLMDTDGWVDKKSKSPYFCSTSLGLAQAVIHLTQSLGGTAKLSEKFPTYNYKGIKKKGLKAYNVLLNLPSGILPFSLTRKLNDYKPNTKYPPRRKIISIEYVHDYESQCISVDHHRSLYVTNDFVLTHNTFVGLGTIKRFWSQNKRNILIVAPTDQKCKDWCEEACVLDLDINILEDVNDPGFEISTTTYANFYQNKAIREKLWDLIVYDESHYLNQNQKGAQTVYLDQHKLIANLPSRTADKAEKLIPEFPQRNKINDEELYIKRLDSWQKQLRAFRASLVDHTKVLFLSATPFAYVKSIKYADGCLFDISEQLEVDNETTEYNKPRGFDKFLCEHFGYRMKHNVCTIPETGVDESLTERQFFETFKEAGVMSTRILELDYDYSRHFVKVDSDIGKFIDSGMELFYKESVKKTYKKLSEFAHKKFRYLYINQLLECAKAQEIQRRVQDHLDLGRKVVIFHSYNHSVVEHPFHFDADKLLGKDEKHFFNKLDYEIEEWENEYSEYVNLNLDNLSNPIDTIKRFFPGALFINGDVPKKKRRLNKNLFNDDNSGCNIIVVQSDAGKEGISLHDKTGKHQRVLIDLSLPTKPIEAIQKEGRVYRSGLKSNAMYEYMVLKTNFEQIAFAEKISKRSKTAENLAMGELARDLETAFKEGYSNAHYFAPNLDQGTGGKEADKCLNKFSEFDKSKTYYYSRLKKTSKTKSFEGEDYFATPEPLGLKMVEWLDPLPGEHGGEFSAGHGAIGRWFPKTSENTFIEPSLKLYSEMVMNCPGKHINGRFQDFYIGNKFHFIAINPPFGRGGEKAINHIKKSLRHIQQYRGLNCNGGRMLVIVPCGAMMDNRLEDLYESDEFRNFRLTGEMLLPSCTFKRAGTTIYTRILRIEHLNTGNQNFNQVDLTYCEDTDDLFDEIEFLNF